MPTDEISNTMTDAHLSIPAIAPLPDHERIRVLEKISEAFRQIITNLQLDSDLETQLERIYMPLASALQKSHKRGQGPLIVGINGAQGSGKTTLCTVLAMILQQAYGLRVVEFSIDDLYLTHADRMALSRSIHPLLQTRGVPGTHDVALGMKLLDDLSVQEVGQQVAIPSFDKSVDDRKPDKEWKTATTPVDIILFEGWCVAARPEDAAMLDLPVNTLEEHEDTDARWRSYVNQCLQGDYARLFRRLDLLIMLKVPDFECVYKWRGLQERKLATTSPQQESSRIMDEKSLQRFIMHYERLTRHMLREMPQRADILLELDFNHHIASMQTRPSA